MLEAALAAAGQFARPEVALALLFGVACGLITGALPAGANLPVLIVLMGFAFSMDPYVAIAIAIGNLAVNGTTDPIPCILLGIPGSQSAQATVLDGYPLARRGMAGQALAAAYAASFMGGIIGAIGLLLTVPIARELLRQFGSAEFFMLGILGVLVVGIVSSGAFIKGVLAACLGMSIAMIGLDPVRALSRMTFGWEFLLDGIHIVPVIVGLFALPELLNLIVGGTPVAAQRLDELMGGVNRGRMLGIRNAIEHKWLVFRSSLIGLFVGMLPGVGGGAAHWMAYAQARQTVKDGTRTFGTGDIRGVIAPESANNSIDAGVLIPTLMFGIPGSGGMAVFLGFLILLGFVPGPAMVNDNLAVTLFIAWCLVLANVIATVVALFFTPQLARIALLRPNVLVPLILALLTISTFQATSSLENYLVVVVFGLLGWFMKLYGWPRPPILIALVLAEPLEKYMSLSMRTYGWEMFKRPQLLIMIGLTVLAVVYMMRVQKQARDAARLSEAAEMAAMEPPLDAGRGAPAEGLPVASAEPVRGR